MILDTANPTELARKHHGLTMFFVDLKAPGIRIEQIRQIPGTADFNEITFEDVPVIHEK